MSVIHFLDRIDAPVLAVYLTLCFPFQRPKVCFNAQVVKVKREVDVNYAIAVTRQSGGARLA